jgi:hypothetical protein
VLNELVGPVGLPFAREQAVTKKIAEKVAIENNMVETMGKIDSRRFKYWGQHVCTSAATPATDGKVVVSAFMGGQKGCTPINTAYFGSIYRI